MMSLAPRSAAAPTLNKLAKLAKRDAPVTPISSAKPVSRILDVIRQSGVRGATCDEVEETTGLSHQTASARVHELMKAGRIVAAEGKRKTRAGRAATVWIAKPERSDA